MTITHPRLTHALLHLRPGSVPLVDFVCVDNGAGPTLVEGSMVNPPTQAEVNAVTAQQLDDAQKDKSIKVDILIGKILFNHENRIRTLAGQPQITMQQFIAAIKALA